MKKSTMMKAALAATALAFSLALSACETNTEQHIYGFGVKNLHAVNDYFNALNIIETYLNERGCIMDNRIYTGSSAAACDTQAQTDLNTSLAKIDSNVLGARLASITTVSFTYTCTGDAGFTGNGFTYSKP
jgi:hypothetical protein